MKNSWQVFSSLTFLLTSLLFGQVGYEDEQPLNNRQPWNYIPVTSDDDNPNTPEKENTTIDTQAGGWYYNLGITGIRITLNEIHPKALIVEYVFPDSLAAGVIQAGDRIIGVNGADFSEEHQNGNSVDVFGAVGPVGEFADAYETAQSASADGTLTLTRVRDEVTTQVSITIGKSYGTFSPTFPFDCPKSEKILSELLPIIKSYQRVNGSFGGGEIHETVYSGLVLLSVGGTDNMIAAKRCAEFLATDITANELDDPRSLVNWYLQLSAIYLSEYYLATGEEWVKAELKGLYDQLLLTQFTNTNQFVEPEDPADREPPIGIESNGGWGHNPGFEGYGPISAITGQGATAFALMQRCGVSIDRTRLDAAYNNLIRTTNNIGHVWYREPDASAFGDNEYSGQGPTGIAALSHRLSNYTDQKYKDQAKIWSDHIGNNPKSFPDNHAGPLMGMAWPAMALSYDIPNLRKLLDANKWWFNMAHTQEKSMYLQPTRDSTESTSYDFRNMASAITALIYNIPNSKLYLTGHRIAEGYEEWAAEHTSHLALLDPYGDFEGDSINNLSEYQNQTNPISDASIISIATSAIRDGKFTYNRMPDNNTTYKVFISFDLTTWAEDSNASQSVVTTSATGQEQVEVQINPSIIPLNSPIFTQVRIR